MDSHEVVREAFKKVSPKQVSSEIGVSTSLVYKWAEPNTESGSGSRNPLDRVNRLREITEEPLILKWLCEQAGGYFVRNPHSTCSQGYEVIPAMNDIVKQFSGLLAEISQAALDNKITEDEAEGIRKVWEELKSYAEGFVSCCEEGDFKTIKQAGPIKFEVKKKK